MVQSGNASKRNIVVIGGSYGGLSIAHHVLKHTLPSLPEKALYDVVLISASSQVMCRPACPRAMISDSMFNQEKLFVNIPEQFKQYPANSFKFVHGTATDLDIDQRSISIQLRDGTLETINYYALVIGTGASSTSPLLGLNGDVTELQSHWAAFRKALPQAKSIVIGGGGPSGIETAGELGEYLNGRAGWFSSKLPNPKVTITVVSAGPKILPQLRNKIAQKAENFLAQIGVTVIQNTKIQSVIPEHAGTSNADLASPAKIILSDGKTLSADIYIPAYGTKPNTSFVPSVLLASDGRIKTNPKTLRVEDGGPRVYVIGDVSSASRPAVHMILEQVPVLGSNLKRDLLLESSAYKDAPAQDSEFIEDRRETQLVPIGKSNGVGAMMGYELPSFIVWLIKGRDYWLWTTGRLWSGKQWG